MEPYIPGSIAWPLYSRLIIHTLICFGVCVINRDICLPKMNLKLNSCCTNLGLLDHTQHLCGGNDWGSTDLMKDVLDKWWSKTIWGWPTSIKTVDIKIGLLLYDTEFGYFFSVEGDHFSEISWGILGLKKCPPNFLNGL